MDSQPTVTFEMPVESLASITGRGVMFVGHIRMGRVSVGDRIEVISAEQPSTATVVGIARMPSRKLVQYAEQGEEIGILVNEFNPDKAGRGSSVSKINMSRSTSSCGDKIVRPR